MHQQGTNDGRSARTASNDEEDVALTPPNDQKPTGNEGAAWDRFRPLPRVVVEDGRLKSHHVDVLIGLLQFTDIKNEGLWMARDVTTKKLAYFTASGRNNLATYLKELKSLRYVVLERYGTEITQIRWNQRTKGVAIALRRRAPWVRVPVAVIHDTSLTARERHAYVALCRHDFYRRFERKSRASRPPDEFYCTINLLADLMHVSDSTAKRLLAALESKHLIEYVQGPRFRNARPMVFVPLNVRYAALRADYGVLADRPKFKVHPRLEDSMTRWRREGRPIPYEGFYPEIVVTA